MCVVRVVLLGLCGACTSGGFFRPACRRSMLLHVLPLSGWLWLRFGRALAVAAAAMCVAWAVIPASPCLFFFCLVVSSLVPLRCLLIRMCCRGYFAAYFCCLFLLPSGRRRLWLGHLFGLYFGSSFGSSFWVIFFWFIHPIP